MCARIAARQICIVRLQTNWEGRKKNDQENNEDAGFCLRTGDGGVVDDAFNCADRSESEAANVFLCGQLGDTSCAVGGDGQDQRRRQPNPAESLGQWHYYWLR